MTKRDTSLDLAPSDEALGLYLDALLREVGESIPATVPAAQALAPVAALPRTAVTVQVEVTEAIPVAVRNRDIQVKVEPQVIAPAPVQTSAPTPAPVATPVANPIHRVKAAPTIPQEPFQALLFRSAGLTVAVPLVDLNGILQYPERLAAVPGLPRWGLGVIRHRELNVIAVDSVALFVPDHLQAVARSRSVPEYLVLLGEGRFGLACDSVDQVVQLRPDEVRWRGERGRRPWLAGTVKERLCALLEVPALVQLLEAGRIESPAE